MSKMTVTRELALDKMQLFEDGTPIVVGRPSKPELVREIAKKHEGSKNWAAVEKELNERCGPYTFVGFVERFPTSSGPMKKHRERQMRQQSPHVIDHEGTRIDRMQSGDSFMHISSFGDFVQIEPEQDEGKLS